MYIGEYLATREGRAWTHEDTAYVLEQMRRVDQLATAVQHLRVAEVTLLAERQDMLEKKVRALEKDGIWIRRWIKEARWRAALEEEGVCE